MKTLKPLAAKRLQRDELNSQLREALAAAKREAKKHSQLNEKRKSVQQLAPYLSVPLNHARYIRESGSYQCRSYSESKQLIHLVDHLFVRFKTPLFLYRTVLSPNGQRLLFDSRPANAQSYRHWFFAVAQGESLAKVAQGTFTKKEAHWFLKAPANWKIEPCISWARCRAAALPIGVCDKLAPMITFKDWNLIGDRRESFLGFMGNAWSTVEKDLYTVLRYLEVQLEDPRYTFRGRSANSVLRAAKEWDRRTNFGLVRKYVEWESFGYAWEEMLGLDGVRFVEITNSRDLAEEATHQRHCVFSYESDCIRKDFAVVSMRWLDMSRLDAGAYLKRRLTIGVRLNSKTLSQVKGKSNRLPNDEEMKVVELWAKQVGLRIPSWLNELN